MIKQLIAAFSFGFLCIASNAGEACTKSMISNLRLASPSCLNELLSEQTVRIDDIYTKWTNNLSDNYQTSDDDLIGPLTKDRVNKLKKSWVDYVNNYCGISADSTDLNKKYKLREMQICVLTLNKDHIKSIKNLGK